MTIERTTKRHSLLALISILGALSLSRPASAQSSVAQARTLFREARTLMDKEQFAEACPKLEESLRLDHGIGTQFNLAHCWEKIGRVVSAWGLFLEVAAGARKENQRKREAAANERAAALEPHLPRMRIAVTEPAPGLKVLRSGEEVGSAAWGTAMPLDPGTYLVEASAPDKEPWSQQVEILPGGETLVVEVPALADVRAPEPTVQASAPTEPERDAPAQSAGSGRKTLAWVLAGAGVLGAGTGVFFGLRAKSETDAARGLCNGGPEGTTCDRDLGLPGIENGEREREELQDHRDKAKQSAIVSYVAFGAGGAALAGAVVLMLTASDDGDEQAQAASLDIQPLLGPEQQGFVLSGSF